MGKLQRIPVQNFNRDLSNLGENLAAEILVAEILGENLGEILAYLGGQILTEISKNLAEVRISAAKNSPRFFWQPKTRQD